MDCCPTETNQYDLVIIGSGSASFAAAIRASELGKTVAMIERATLGGTCVNVGCVPSKTLIRAAESKFRAEHSPFRGIKLQGAEIDFATLIREKDTLVDSLRRAKYENVLHGHDNISLIKGEASFVSSSEVRVGDRVVTGDRFLIASGADAWAPPVPGLSETAFLTSTTLFELESLPGSLAIIGGRSIALELAQMMQRLGSQVTILQRSEHILPNEDSDLTEALTGYLTDEGIRILTGVQLQKVSQGKTFSVDYQQDDEDRHLEAEQLLVAAGRRPNTEGLGLEQIGVEINADWSVKTDEYCRTTIPHIYAAGDVAGKPAFVYTAAYAGKLAVDNAFGNRRVRNFAPLPYVVFTDPQVARVGLNEQMAKAQGLEIDTAKLSLDNVPRALAARDTRGCIKLIKEKEGDHLLGASILAPEGSELLMEVALAIQYKISVHELAGMLHPYLTMGEGVKLAAQTFDKDVKQLSCCAA
ncbi:MAG TPA: mercury(II) reductase [Desulfobulbus sp.]|nr:mercury(II) reductase [Desulfobulbus sp.]